MLEVTIWKQLKHWPVLARTPKRVRDAASAGGRHGEKTEEVRKEKVEAEGREKVLRQEH
jgi:hypothetical protein